MGDPQQYITFLSSGNNSAQAMIGDWIWWLKSKSFFLFLSTKHCFLPSGIIFPFVEGFSALGNNIQFLWFL